MFKKNLKKDESGSAVIGAVSGGFFGLLAEAGLLVLDVSGIGCGNLFGIYPWTAMHIYPLIGLTTIGGILGGAAGTIVDGLIAVTAVTAGTFGCVGSSLMGNLMSK